jgi:VanZ family protein
MKWPAGRIVWATLLWCALVATLDELHQRLVPGRTPLLSDVLIDLAGAMLGMVAMALWWGKRALRRQGTEPSSDVSP